ncbi:hypothetical protein F4809DRAFT_318948 [Biscogniauxia mediterranea]|nr:hypothetical protein F4809DRAFT_318948 [Biscogniauxia mediterranea]
MATSKANRTNWNNDTHRDLLLAIMDHAPPSLAQWDKIIAQVHRQGYVYTQGAAIQHLSKLRAKENNGNGNDAANAGSSAPATPKKAGGKGAKATPRTATTTGKRKAKKKALRDDLDDDDDDDIVDDDETPTKKVKKEMLIDADQENGNAKLAKSLFGNHDNMHDDEV